MQHLGADFAILTAHFAETFDGAPEAYRVTDVFTRHGLADGDEWRLAHSQWTRLPGEWRADSAVDVASLLPLVGQYVNDTGAMYRVAPEGDRGLGGLRITFPSGQSRVFTAHSRDLFFRPQQADEWVFIRTSGTAVPGRQRVRRVKRERGSHKILWRRALPTTSSRAAKVAAASPPHSIDGRSRAGVSPQK